MMCNILVIVTHPVDPLIFNIYSPYCTCMMSRVILSYGTSLQIFHLKSDFYNIIFHLKSTFISQGRLESNTKCFRNNHVLRAENFASARKKTVPYEKCEFCRLMTEDWYIYVNFRWNNYKWMLLINVQFFMVTQNKDKVWLGFTFHSVLFVQNRDY